MDKAKFSGFGNVAPLERARDATPSLGELLVSAGRLSADAASRVATRQRERGIPFGQAAVELGLVSEADVRAALARQFDYPVLAAGDPSVAPELVAAFTPDAPQVEALRKLRSQLVLRRAGNPHCKTVAVVGAGRGEGRSWLVANLAITFSQLGERTLVMDADLRTPRQQALFRLPPAGGLAAHLAERGDSQPPVVHPRFPGLAIQPAGNVPPNPQELLARSGFAAHVTAARDFYDMVLVDTPADEVGADAQLVAAACGFAVVVARRHITAHKRAGALAASLRDAGVTILGGVLLEF
ncbi:MAG TPA: polysaccharide biosynthesis tyrosine autokinase [Rhodocyclaceae bacterium]|uniref:polysaccharide biosynthesis tyrosine autokinase n=1 Tax=Zoogloea sp. TaxID=49181 RepID=UPI002C21981D|nr:polysaccharide biosynthesis tyrosine autokinase [Zoogloea sp.]HMV18775.1 polysaccharide biosynthesis tyrosine autokinase [Rhodocyclaceae bacterium]HMV64662.1 polysaccharide biosynthesis tyrosine autokinase [Rhodocyclaceae bacterium]HMY48103.1 polysaccharide biosynthesis tyrosine autokinase [Rhodocyclaceae bacterium]HMZ74690.1 polysaccharide biosynthesis tyrosine autokinase [Rhodocyclaceae bacterium]HNA67007.1 polysaccharide biosynthesis tyrosine autokinase [Rhodocyclaceae bacterium]